MSSDLIPFQIEDTSGSSASCEADLSVASRAIT